MALTDAKLKTAKPDSAPYYLPDSHGLRVLVAVSGVRSFQYRYRFPGRNPKTGAPKLVERLLTLGTYPSEGHPGISLKEARSARDDARKLLDKGIDPSQQRKADKRANAVASANDFRSVTERWLAGNKSTWTANHWKKVDSRMKADVLPHLGPLAIASITPPTVLQVLRKVEKRSVQVAHRNLEHISAVFRLAISEGVCTSDPSRDLRGALRKVERAEHFAALTEDEMPEFLRKLAEYDGHAMTPIAIELLIRTVVRTGELRGATWSEFNLAKAEWRIPAARMKQRAEHVVPLSTQAVALLRRLQGITGHDPADFAFPNTVNGNKPMSENTILYACYRMGYHSRVTGHGFRSTFSTMMNESGVAPDWIEQQLAHVPKNKVRSAYLRSTFLPQRKQMMQAWSDRIDAMRDGAKVVSIRRGKTR